LLNSPLSLNDGVEGEADVAGTAGLLGPEQKEIEDCSLSKRGMELGRSGDALVSKNDRRSCSGACKREFLLPSSEELKVYTDVFCVLRVVRLGMPPACVTTRIVPLDPDGLTIVAEFAKGSKSSVDAEAFGGSGKSPSLDKNEAFETE
jgi:hypothetical protein